MARINKRFVEYVANKLSSFSYAKFVSPKAAQFILTVDPSKVIYYIPTERYVKHELYCYGLVVKNTNDIVSAWSFEKMHPTIMDMFVNNIDYKKTEQYLTMMAGVENYLSNKGLNPKKLGCYWCRSKEDVDKYFLNLYQAYSSIKNQGYKTQIELSESAMSGKFKKGDELKFVISGNGDLVFLGSGANHRFSIVKQLGLTSVKGVLAGVDKQWLKKSMSSKNMGRRGIVDVLINIEGITHID